MTSGEGEGLEWLAEVIVECADAAGIGVLVLALVPEVRAVFASRSGAAIFGLTPEDLLATDPLSFFDASERARLAAIADAVARRGADVPQIQATGRRADRSAFTVDVALSPTSVDGTPGVVCFVVDVTERTHAEQSLSLSEDRFRRVIETVPEAIYITHGRILEYANPAFLELFGLSREESIAGRSILDFVYPDDVDAFAERSRTVLDRTMPPVEYRMTAESGRTVTLEVSSIAIDFEGRPCILSFGRDVTDRKHSEAQLIQADRLAALGTLAGGMAHAINNPLSYVLLNLEHLSRRIPELTRRRDVIAEARVRLAEARDGAERVAAVVRQMRHFSRMRKYDDAGPVDVRTALQAALDLVANEIKHRGQLVTDLREVPLVYGSEGQIEQALLTLLIFAARSLPEESPREGRLELETMVDSAGWVVVTVRCIGVVLSAQAQERIFEPFSSVGEDAGLGLAMCADIVSSMNGTIRVEGDAESTVFHVTLPPTELLAAPLAESIATAETARSRAEVVRARVLVIDDDPGVGSALRMLLQEQHDVTSVSSAREGLRALLEENEFDVVFCDLMMPDMSGEDVYHATMLNKPGTEAKIVFMTGAAFTPEVERFLSSVPNARVEKPFNLEYVDQALRRVVRTVRG